MAKKAAPAAAPPKGPPPKGKSAKAPKDKRSKAQIKADDNAAETRKMLDYWIKLKSFVILAFGQQPLSEDGEQQFLALTSALTKQHRTLQQFMPRDIDTSGQAMVEMLKSSVSLEHLRSLPEPDKKKLYGDGTGYTFAWRAPPAPCVSSPRGTSIRSRRRWRWT